MINEQDYAITRIQIARLLKTYSRVQKLNPTSISTLGNISRPAIYRLEAGCENTTIDAYFRYIVTVDPSLLDEIAELIKNKLRNRREEIRAEKQEAKRQQNKKYLPTAF